MTDTAASAQLTQLGEAYFVTQHSYDPYNATLLGVAEFDGLSFDPSRDASERADRRFFLAPLRILSVEVVASSIP